METRRRLVDLYRFPGFRPRASVRGVFGDPQARVVSLERRGKKLCAAFAANDRAEFTIASGVEFEISPVGMRGSTSRWRSVASGVGAAAR
jgi:hypothetical protein